METVIVMPLLVALIFGALQLAHIHVARQVVSYAAYAAARSTLSVAKDKEKEEDQYCKQDHGCENDDTRPYAEDRAQPYRLDLRKLWLFPHSAKVIRPPCLVNLDGDC